MLLFNFLCVFYLMVLVNSHTISKSIAEYNFDDESDSLFDIDYTRARGRKNRHDVFLHKFKREEKERVTQPTGTKKILVELTTVVPRSTKTPKAHEKIKAHHKFWRKFKMKNKKPSYDRRKRYKHKRITINPRYPNRITAHENYRLSNEAKRKREASVVVDAKLNKNLKEKNAGTSTTHSKSGTSTRSTDALTTDDKTISGITKKLTNLKLKYGMEKYNFLPKFNKVLYQYRPYATTSTLTSESTTEDTEFPGTAQIEALLNDIKARAIQMISEQNPAITEMLTNAATEATFEADPLLRHVGVTDPRFALTTFVTLSNLEEINKRTINDSNIVVISDKDSHNISVRSCKENAFTIAQNVEDKLQQQLKNIYKKVKSKVVKDYHKEMKTVRSTLAGEKKKIVDKIDKTIGKVAESTKPQSKCTESKKCTTQKISKTAKTTKRTRQARADILANQMTKTTVEQETTPSIDDIAMLTLYEQILSKTHEDNVMKMLTTYSFMKLDGRLSKRYPSTDSTNADTMYDEIILNNSEIDNSSSKYQTQTPDYNLTGTTDVEKTSYEGLVDKISFNDYVNGYKHYLNFQKDQAASNFSNMVKFQAHRHHKVDDIGKFILNKIPHLPNRKRRYFFDDSDIDYQDVSTKSDDSWFKKHFYMFIDNGPPKKYHTSETVNFKEVVTEGIAIRVGFTTPNLEDSMVDGVTESAAEYNVEQDSNFINLEALYKVLEDRKQHSFLANRYLQSTSSPNSEDQLEEGGLAFKIISAPNAFSKWFGNKKSRKLRKSTNNKYSDTSFDSYKVKRDASIPKLRNLTSNVQVRSTVYASPHTERSKAINKNKNGCVSIDVVSQPTSIVKLRSSTKHSKFKELLKKLHLLRKKNKQKRQAKVRRFNPFKKLKDIFKISDDDKAVDERSRFNNDYDIMNSHIDTFKPVKYNSVPSMEDLKYQIPNITNEYGLPYDDQLRTPGMMANKEHIINIGYETDLPHFDKSQTKPLAHNTVSAIKKETRRKYTTTRPSTTTTATTMRFNPSLDDIMSINIKTASNLSQPAIPGSQPQHMSIQDIKNELEMLNSKMTSQRTTKYTTSWTLPQPGSNMVANSAKIVKINQKDYVLEPISQPQRGNNKPKKKYFGKKPDSIKKKPVSDFTKVFKLTDYNYLQKRKPKNILDEIGTELSNTELADVNLSVLEDVNVNKLEPHRDDFNDLLLWHGDILSYNAFTSPAWNVLLDSQRYENYTTPNLLAMQDELNEMRSLLNSFKDFNIVIPPKKDSIKNKTANNVGVNLINALVGSYNKRKRDGYNNGNTKTMVVTAENDKNTINEFYTTKEDVKRNEESSRATDEIMESILMDNTVLSYDDSVDSITETSRKIILRNPLKPNKKKNKPPLVLKSNKQPEQSFNTPFPMTMKKFKMFLKQNDLDVETVTAPIIDPPNLLNHLKPNVKNSNDKHNMKQDTDKEVANEIEDNLDPQDQHNNKDTAKDVTSEIEDDSDPEDQIEYMNQELDYLHNDINYQYNDPMRYRQRKFFKDKSTNDPTKKRSEIKDKEVEITIINFDDANKLFKELNTYKSKFPEENERWTTFLSDVITDKTTTDSTTTTTTHSTTTKLKPLAKKPVKINEGPSKDTTKKKITTKKITSKRTNINTITKYDDASNVHVYGHSFHYNFLFGPNKKLKVINGNHKKSSTHKVFSDYIDDNGYRLLKDRKDFHRFGREVQTTSTEIDVMADLTLDIKYVTEQAAATVNKMWSKFVPESLIMENSTSNITKETSDAMATEMANITSTSTNSTLSLAKNKTITNKKKMPTKNNKLFDEMETDKYNNLKDIMSPSDISVTGHDHNNIMTTTKHKTTPTDHKKEIVYVEEGLPEDLLSTSAEVSVTTNVTSEPMQITTTKDKTTNTDADDISLQDATPLPEDVSFTTKVGKESYNNGRMITTKHNSSTKGHKKEDVYVEEVPPDNVTYYEFSPKKHPATLDAKRTTLNNTTPHNNIFNLFEKAKNLKSKLKRNAPVETFTAKDVAAIEVVVDLLKNTMNSVSEAPTNILFKKDKTTTTNAIQVHIAIPYDMDVDKKRSLDPQRIRKVFSAKMATPVDLEYQIHSVEERESTPSSDETSISLSPGMYLVVDNNTGTYSLKPVKYNKTAREVHRHLNNKSNISGKVTLSKDFLASINEQLLRLYENLTANLNQHKIVSRNAPWEKIKKFFGHDRVCHCKCRANRTMCRTCFASEDVVNELTIAFENLSKYMTDHCTEIQTFFWMNPMGGKKLRDLVNNIDSSLSDYYKRVKGKCQGRPCKTFSSLDKRGTNKTLNELNAFLDCIKELSQNIDMVLNNVPYNDGLKDAGEKFVQVTKNCARSLDQKLSQVKKAAGRENAYSLDNINVNIICDPSARKFTEYNFNPTEIDAINCANTIKKKKSKIFQKLFLDHSNRPKNKLFTYYVTEVTPKMGKRETFDSQLESPLIADTGGSFWQEYIGKNDEMKTGIKSQTTRDETSKYNNKLKDKFKKMYPSQLFPTPTHKVVHEKHKPAPGKSTPKYYVSTEELMATEMESLSHNIAELMKIFDKVYQYENLKKEIMSSNTEVTTHTKTTKHKRTNGKKVKKIHKTTTAKAHKKGKQIKHTDHTKHHAAAATTTKKALSPNSTPTHKEIKNVSIEERNKHQHLTETTLAPFASESDTMSMPDFLEKSSEANKLAVTATVEAMTFEPMTDIYKPTKKPGNNIFSKLKHATAGLFHAFKNKMTAAVPKHNREADVIMTEMNEGRNTQVTIFTNKIITDTKDLTEEDFTPTESKKDENLLFLQRTYENNKQISDLKKTLNEIRVEINDNDTDSTTEMNTQTYEIIDNRRRYLSQVSTTQKPPILMVISKANKGNDFKRLFKSMLDSKTKLKRESVYRTMDDIEDIMMTYTTETRTTETKQHDLLKSFATSLKPLSKKQKNKHAIKQTDKKHDKQTHKGADKHADKNSKEDALKEIDVQYDMMESLKSLELPTPIGMSTQGPYGFSIKLVPDTRNKNKGSTPSKQKKETYEIAYDGY